MHPLHLPRRTPAGTDPGTRPESLAHRQAAFKATADRAWQALMDAYDLRPRPPFRLRDLTNAVAAMITRSVVIWFADAEGLADPAGEENRSLTGRTILAFFEHFTEPAT